MDPSQQGHQAPNAGVLLIIGEPFSEEQKILILEQITKGFQCWNVEDTGININEVLAKIASRASFGEEGAGGERFIQHLSDNLSVEIVINPLTQTVKNSIKKLLIAPTSIKYIIYAGQAFQGSGAWVLQDDTFTFSSLAQVVRNIDVENALKQNTAASLTIHTLEDSNWGPSITKADFSSNLRIQLNPAQKLDSIQGIHQFVAYVGGFVKVVPITNLLQASEQFGNISFTRPTLYIFPGCQGDSALFGISGFNLLVNGGYNRRACFWDFARHLDRVDAMLMTHLGTDNIFGLKSVLQRKSLQNVHPDIGYLYFNAPEKPSLLPAEEEGEGDSSIKSRLLINLAEEASQVTSMAKQLGISAHPCCSSATAASCDAVNLYHKVGHGSLDMYVLNPVADSKELKEFYQLWSKNAPNLGTNGPFPLQNVLSVCALLVWRPYNLDEKIVRIMFPGNAPQHRVIEGFEKVKTFDFLKHAYCTTRELIKQQAPVRKVTLGSAKSGAASKGPAKSTKSETGKSSSATKVESPRKEAKTFPVKPEARMLSPTKSTKPVKEESSSKVSKVIEKPKTIEKDGKSKFPTKEADKETLKSPRPISASNQVKGSGTGNKVTSPSKCSSATKSSPIEDSSPSTKSPVKTSAPAVKEEPSVTEAGSAGQTASGASDVHLVDLNDIKQEFDEQQPILSDTQTLNTVSEACDAAGAIEDTSVSNSSAADKQQLENLGIYGEKYASDCADRGTKYDIEEDERPQALPEPTIMIEAQSLVSDNLHDPSCKVSEDVQEQVGLDTAKGHMLYDETLGDVTQNISQSPEPSEREVVQLPEPSESEVRHSPEPSESEVRQSPEPSGSEVRQSPEPSGSEVRQSQEPSEREVVQSQEPSESEVVQSQEPSESTIPRSTEPSESEVVQSQEPSESEVVQSQEPSESEIVQSTEPSESKVVQSTELSESKVVQSTEPSESEVVQSTEPSESEVVQSTEPSESKQHDCQVTSSSDRQAEFETPVFTNDEPDAGSVSQQLSVEHNIQYGIDNSSHGRDMGGIQEVDEEENEDDISNEKSLDNEALQETATYDNEEDAGIEGRVNGFGHDSTHDDSDVKEEEEEEEICSDSRTSAERQFEDVDDESSQQAQDDVDERIEDDEHSSLPAAFDKDSSPEVDASSEIVTREEQSEYAFTDRDDRDSLDGATPSDDQILDEPSTLNGDVDHLAEKVVKTYSHKAVEEPTLKHAFDEALSAVGGHTQNQNFGAVSDDEAAASFDPAAQWGHPMGLPSPQLTDRRPPTAEGKKVPAGAGKAPKPGAAAADTKPDGKKRPVTTSAKGASQPVPAAKKASNSSSRSSPVNTKISTLPPMNPFYVDLTYVPNHADLSYSDVEFFKRIRARYYVISTLNPNPQVFDSLLEAKATWEQKDLEVTIIPTYDNDTLRHWMGLNTEKLQQLRVDLKPAVSRCTIQLQDLETSLPAYRLEV